MDFKLIVSLVSLLICIACYVGIRRMRIALQRPLQASTVVVESSTAVRDGQPDDSAAFTSIVSRSGLGTFFAEVDESLKWFVVAVAILILWGVVAVLDATGMLTALGMPFDFR